MFCFENTNAALKLKGILFVCGSTRIEFYDILLSDFLLKTKLRFEEPKDPLTLFNFCRSRFFNFGKVVEYYLKILVTYLDHSGNGGRAPLDEVSRGVCTKFYVYLTAVSDFLVGLESISNGTSWNKPNTNKMNIKAGRQAALQLYFGVLAVIMKRLRSLVLDLLRTAKTS